MELRDLYDENKELTGETIYKGQDVPKGRYYITVVVFIQNSKNEFLIQKRVKKKDGKWATTGGHPVSGETSKQGIISEIKEELGVDIVKENIKLFKTIKTEDDFVDIYYLKEDIDIKKIKIQKEEVEDVKWATIEEINETFQNNQNETLNYTTDPIVSSDIISSTYGATVDGNLTNIIEVEGKQLIHVVAWYDNEMGYSYQMVRTLKEL